MDLILLRAAISELPSDTPMRLSVLIPVYNERKTLFELLGRVQAVDVDKEIIVVDNCSTDGTREELQSLLEAGHAESAQGDSYLRIVLQPQNGGKGSSVRCALGLARGEYVIVQDADLEYDPQDYLKLLALASERDCLAVFGTRLAPGSAARREQPHTAFYYGRVGLSVLFRLLYRSPLSDVATCYKLMRREVACALKLRSSGFDLDFEIAARLAKLSRRGLPILEAPVSYHPRTEIEGKKIRAWRDGWRGVWALLKYRFTD